MGRFIKIALVLALAFLAWIVVVAIVAYAQARGRVDRIAHANSLTISPRDLTERQVCALLTVQDPTFYQHHGIALFDGSPGHTTITQSIDKWLYFENFNPGFLHERKVRLMATALGFDLRIAKEEQLRLFLSRSYFGTKDGIEIHGFSDAARAYFQKDLRSLSEKEFLALVAMMSAPNLYDPIRHPEQNAQRVTQLQPLVERLCRSDCTRAGYGGPCAL